MHKIALLALLTLLSGCTAGLKYANYGSSATANPALDKKMAEDAVKKLTTLYPPAITRFELQQIIDPFGTSFVSTLREHGYALQEAKSASTSGGKGASRVLSYVFDQPAGTDLYRVTLTIDAEKLSRVYLAKDGSVAPAGYWVRKE